MTSLRLKIKPEGTSIDVSRGSLLKPALAAHGIHLRGHCGGRGTCGLCEVHVDGRRTLACTYHVESDATLFVPTRSRQATGDLGGPAVDSDLASDAREVGAYLAVDVGTTTINLALVTVAGALIATSSAFNPQASFGDDVISRIVYASEHPHGIGDLREAVVAEINRQVRDICELAALVPERHISRVVMAGNTTMSHILLGSDLEPIRREEVTDQYLELRSGTAKDFGLNLNRETPVIVLPQISAFVGGDIVAGLVASGMAAEPGVRLLIDIGTNGEIVLGNDEWLIACACSAGPAFEGAGVTVGMPAIRGAIADVSSGPSGQLAYSTIGGVEPQGLCGSGLIALLATLLQMGVIDRAARFVRHSPLVEHSDIGPRVVISRGNDALVALTEPDLGALLRAKAAVYAGVSALCAKVGIDIHLIDQILVAGGFGNSLDVEKAVAIGLVPDVPRNRFSFVGNTSLAGAVKCLTDERALAEAGSLARRVTYVDLMRDSPFMDEFIAAMFLPHTDIARFPSASKSSRAGIGGLTKC